MKTTTPRLDGQNQEKYITAHHLPYKTISILHIDFGGGEIELHIYIYGGDRGSGVRLRGWEYIDVFWTGDTIRLVWHCIRSTTLPVFDMLRKKSICGLAFNLYAIWEQLTEPWTYRRGFGVKVLKRFYPLRVRNNWPV